MRTHAVGAVPSVRPATRLALPAARPPVRLVSASVGPSCSDPAGDKSSRLRRYAQLAYNGGSSCYTATLPYRTPTVKQLMGRAGPTALMGRKRQTTVVVGVLWQQVCFCDGRLRASLSFVQRTVVAAAPAVKCLISS